MLSTPTSRSPDLQKLSDDGYEVSVHSGHLVISGVPYVNERREVCRGSLVSALEMAGDVTARPSNHVAYFVGERPCDQHGQPLTAVIHEDQPRDLAPGLHITCGFSCKPAEGYPDYYEKMVAYVDILGGFAAVLEPGATARTFRVLSADEDSSGPFQYLDTASSRSGVADIASRLLSQRVGIVGLGGTGSYILDFVAKAAVAEIRVFDGDRFLQHNAFRAPGAPTRSELEQMPFKVDRFVGIYGSMHSNIEGHAAYIDETSVSMLCGLDFVFIAIDHGASKRIVIEYLVSQGIPFVDVGIGIWRNDSQLGGLIRTSMWSPGHDDALPSISLGDGDDGNEYARNIQIAELNAANAAFAVLRWKRHLGIYADYEDEATSVYEIDGNLISNEQGPK